MTSPAPTPSSVEVLEPELDLDDLLSESLELADARRASRQGRKLTEAQAETLAANSAALHFESWRSYMLICHVELTTCSCGCAWEGFGGWYEYQVNRRDESRQMLQRVESSELPTLPRQKFQTLLEVQACDQCAPWKDLPLADPQQLPMLESFGEVAEWQSEEEVAE